MQKINYNIKMKEEIDKLDSKARLLLHSCCAPCSTQVIKRLMENFNIEVFFFNPNIYPKDEYMKRLEEQRRLVNEMGLDYRVVDIGFKDELFYESIKGLEHLGEGSERCNNCFELRLRETAKYARENNFDYFATTLTISPMKNAQVINKIGEKTAEEYGVKFLYSDFKKENGFKKSIEISKDFDLYRQDYCGCVFSKRERDERLKENK